MSVIAKQIELTPQEVIETLRTSEEEEWAEVPFFRLNPPSLDELEPIRRAASHGGRERDRPGGGGTDGGHDPDQRSGVSPVAGGEPGALDLRRAVADASIQAAGGRPGAWRRQRHGAFLPSGRALRRDLQRPFSLRR